MSQETSLSALRNTRPNTMDTAMSAGFADGPSYALLRSIAKDFAASDLVPQRYQGKPANCLIAINMALRMQADPLQTMQHLFVVHGTPSWSSQFLIACFNQTKKYAPIQYEFFGKEGTDEWGCRAFSTYLKTGERIEGSKVTIAIAKKEGWYQKNGSKWQSMGEQMLRYRAAAWLIRAHTPEIGIGFQTTEEVHDVYDIDLAPEEYQITMDEIRKADKVTSVAAPAEKPKQDKKTAPAKPPVESTPQAKQAHLTPEAAEAPQSNQQPPVESTPLMTYLYPILCPDTGQYVEEDACPECTMFKGCPIWETREIL